MKIYCVSGQCGEFDDYKEWIVCFYPFIEQAKEHCKRANEVLKLEIERHNDLVWEDKIHYIYTNPYDTNNNMQFEYDPKYTVEEYEFYEGLDAYIDAKGI